jgi:hypothetical protein
VVVASVLSEVSMEVSDSEEPVVGVVAAEQPVRIQAARITVTLVINDLFITLLFIDFLTAELYNKKN